MPTEIKQGRQRVNLVGLLVAIAISCIPIRSAWAQVHGPIYFPEQRSVSVRDPAGLPKSRLPDTPAPTTVSQYPSSHLPEQPVSLNEAIRIALRNSEVVRLLSGVQATSSGSTIFDPTISNTSIDESQARFDPVLQVLNGFNRVEQPVASFDPLDPSRTNIGGIRSDDYSLNLDLTKTTTSGGILGLGVNTNPSRLRPGVFPLNPQNRSSVDLSYTQPLLQGAGFAANLAPIVISRIDTERSYFRFKGSVQQLMRGVIEAYWAVVLARVNVWAIGQQLDQLKFAYDREEARFPDFANAAQVAQTRLALANFRVSLVNAQANLLQREAALRNIMGLPPVDGVMLLPITPPTFDQLKPDWKAILSLAEERRPDLIELKLIIEADEQLLLQSRNQALPKVDAVMLYRWNGLEGEMPVGSTISSQPGQFTDWTLGVNFSVPLGLRQARAGVRRQELVIMRDRANLQQGVHNLTHTLATSVRSLDQFYEQYKFLHEARLAARINLDQQFSEYESGIAIFLNVLQAVTDWGNAVSGEAQSLLQYNIELANLETQTGTILETHGVHFVEERFGAIGPLGRFAKPQAYPESISPSENSDVYPVQDKESESVFNLQSPYPRASNPANKPGSVEPEKIAPPEPLPGTNDFFPEFRP